MPETEPLVVEEREEVTAELHWDLLSGILVLGKMFTGGPSSGIAVT